MKRIEKVYKIKTPPDYYIAPDKEGNYRPRPKFIYIIVMYHKQEATGIRPKMKLITKRTWIGPGKGKYKYKKVWINRTDRITKECKPSPPKRTEPVWKVKKRRHLSTKELVRLKAA